MDRFTGRAFPASLLVVGFVVWQAACSVADAQTPTGRGITRTQNAPRTAPPARPMAMRLVALQGPPSYGYDPQVPATGSTQPQQACTDGNCPGGCPHGSNGCPLCPHGVGDPSLALGAAGGYGIAPWQAYGWSCPHGPSGRGSLYGCRAPRIWYPTHHHTYAYRPPKNLVYPPQNQLAAVVQYPFYTVKGPTDFFYNK